MLFYDYLLVTILVFTRIASIFGVIPIFGAKNTPVQTKVGLIFFVAIIVVPIQLSTFDLQIDSFIDLGGYMIIESLIGFSIGLVTLIILNAFYLAGSLVDRNIGFAMVSVISAQDESQLPVSANFFYIFALMIFIITDIHHLLIRTILDSYTAMPIGSNPIFGLIVFDYTEVLSYTFEIGFKMAAPFILVILIANILLGLLSKAMPGMNVFMIGMPLKIFVGLFVFYLVMGLYSDVVLGVFGEMMRYIYRLIGI